VVEAEGVPNGMAIVFRKLGAEDRIRALARRFVESLERVAEPPKDELVTGRVRARVDYADAPDGAMVTFVPEDLDFELDHVDAVIESVRRSADEMRETRRCTAPDGVAIVGA
jgi:hypothetical protein